MQNNGPTFEDNGSTFEDNDYISKLDLEPKSDMHDFIPQQNLAKIVENKLAAHLDAFVDTILSFKENNHEIQKGVDAALKKALMMDKIVVVKKILTHAGGKKPSQEAVAEVFLKAVRFKMLEALEATLSVTGDNKPSQANVDKAIMLAELSNYVEAVEKILSHAGENKPSQEAVGQALIWASKNRHDEIVEKILSHAGENKPSQEAVGQALIWALKNRHDGIVEKILSHEVTTDQTVPLIEQIKSEMDKLKKLINEAENSNIVKIFSIALKCVELKVDNNEVSTYLVDNGQIIKDEIEKIPKSSATTRANILASIGTILFCFTGLGLVINLALIWPRNLEKRGSSFMFFDSGAQQKAVVVGHLLNQFVKKSKGN